MFYKIAFNRCNKTYTIRVYYDNGKLCNKYRSYPQGKEYSEDWTQSDIYNFLVHTDDYYKVI